MSTAQPPSAPATAPAQGATASAPGEQPGRPYYETLRAQLRTTLAEKRKIDEELVTIEEALYKAEGQYLEDTALSGNILKGFDNWVKGVQINGRLDASERERRKSRGVTDDLRLFSKSSVGWGDDQLLPLATFAQDNLNLGKQVKTPTTGEDASAGGKRGKVTFARE
ncbi:NuA4-domain-containing protein [Piedraia hortae CBS 480.64]|uniref:Chromatin modification-related protein EAF6 n=1 Tax=Piedraia hortae CBS 480.64 TaxID=1314780 RepID=A0A6A7BV28_9PEZI|nr:NuA4-domain-containing protein [Piedraia hortae CBS 480.64]